MGNNGIRDNRHKANQIETQERRIFVLELAKSGATYRQIADATIAKFGKARLPAGWDERYAYKDVARELEKLNNLANGLAIDVKKLQLERLDSMFFIVWQQVMSGDLQAIDRALRIMERRAKLLDLDSPKQIVISDWREKAKEEGIDVSTLFEELVQWFASSMDGRSNGGGDAGGEAQESSENYTIHTADTT